MAEQEDDIVNIEAEFIDQDAQFIKNDDDSQDSQSLINQVQYQMDESEASDTSFIELTTKIGNDSKKYNKHHYFSGQNEMSDFKYKTMDAALLYEIES